MNISIEHFPAEYLRMIYRAGRNCYGARNACSDNGQMAHFAKKLISLGHESVLEHVSVSIYATDVSRSFLAQITRHRLVSYSVKSQHYVKHHDFRAKKLEDYGDNPEIAQRNQIKYQQLMNLIGSFYQDLIDSGVKHYIAREVLPNACLTDIYMTANVREWRHIITMRITPNNTPEIRLFAREVLWALYTAMPELFDDLMGKYAEAAAK